MDTSPHNTEALSNRCRYFHADPVPVELDDTLLYKCPDCNEIFFAHHPRGERLWTLSQHKPNNEHAISRSPQ